VPSGAVTMTDSMVVTLLSVAFLDANKVNWTASVGGFVMVTFIVPLAVLLDSDSKSALDLEDLELEEALEERLLEELPENCADLFE